MVDKTKMIIMMPALVKASAYVLLGIGSFANVLGYQEIGSIVLTVASVLGVSDAAQDAKATN